MLVYRHHLEITYVMLILFPFFIKLHKSSVLFIHFHFHFHDSHKNDAHFSPQHNACIQKKYDEISGITMFVFMKILFTLEQFVVLLLDHF